MYQEITEITDRTPQLMHQLLEVWERSVRATHLFLSADEVAEIKPYVPQALREIPHLVAAWRADGAPAGFLGVDGRKLEMLFLAPEERGKGLGRKLVQLPLAVAMSLVPSLGALTGMAVLDVCSDLYGEILYRTGKGEPLETLTFGVPLGLMQLLVPTRIPVRQVTRPKEVAQRLWRMVLQGMVHGVQKEQMDHVLKRKKKQKPTDKEASGEN